MWTMDDSYRLEDFGLRAKEDHDHPLLAEFDRKTMPIPGRPGAWDFGTEVKTKPFSIPLTFIGRSMVEAQRSFNEFTNFITDEYGLPRSIKISFDYEPDKFYMVKLSAALSPKRASIKSELVVNVEAVDPHKRLHVENHEIHWDSTTATFDDSWAIDTTFVHDQLITRSQTLETYINGLAIRPDILISGSGSNVTISANGKSFTLKDFSNAEILIRGSDYTCFKNGVDTMTEMTGGLLTLLPGSNQVTVTGSSLNFTLSIILRDQYN